MTRRGRDTESPETNYAVLAQDHWAKGEQDRALEYGRRCLELAEARDDLTLRVIGELYICHAYLALGQYAAAVERTRVIAATLDGPRATEPFGLSGLPYSGACALGAEALAQLGDHGGALELLDRGARVVEAADHLYSRMVLAQARGAVLVLGGDTAGALAVLEPTLAMCREKGFADQIINAARHLADAYVRAGRGADAISRAQEAIDLQEKAKACVSRSTQLTALGRGYMQVGNLAQADAALQSALDFSERCGERGWGGWATLAAGELALSRGDRAAAEQAFDEAQEVAEELAMRPLVEACRARLRHRR